MTHPAAPAAAPAARRRGALLLYADPLGIDSHRVRHFLAEKGIAFELQEVSGVPSAELLELNPLGNLPTLLDRELALPGLMAILDYLEERFPHPPMMPVDPVARARTRLAAYRIEQDWHRLLGRRGAATGDPDPGRDLPALQRSLADASELFEAMPFFLSPSVSLLDTMLSPLLWRVRGCGIVLEHIAAPVAAYAERMFAREAFRASLSGAQRHAAGGQTTARPRGDS